MNLRFEQPMLLLLILLAVPLALIGLRALRLMDPVRRATALALRTLLLLLVVMMLAGPHRVREHDRVTVIGLVDVSASVRRFGALPTDPEMAGRGQVDAMRRWFRAATESRQADDRVGLVAFDGEAVAISAPTSGRYVDDNLDLADVEGTNIADAIRFGRAMAPADTAARLVLISDGNETVGDALDTARQAGGIPIDVVPLQYNVTGDAQIVRIEAPPSAQPGQVVTVRIILEATEPITGRLALRREGLPVDLDPDQPGTSRRVRLPAGQSVHLVQVALGETPINRFEAAFEPDDPSRDMLPDNNRAEAFTATPSRGTVFVLTEASGGSSMLASMLRVAEVPVTVDAPAMLPDDLISLQNYNLIVLDDVPAYALTTRQQRLLAQYVERLGGGLIMIGGESSFGAGGWMRTPVAEILPVDLDPPKELRQPRAALVLVLDKSGSMGRSVAGARASQQEVANEGAALAIESLQRETFIGAVTFNHSPDTFIPLQRNEDPAALAREIRTIQPGGGTQIQPALRRGYEMLREVDVENRAMVLLTDGISHDPDMESFIRQMAAENIRITTIGVGDEIDDATLRSIADTTGGTFYQVRNPRTLPRVLVDSVQEFTPVVRATGSTLTAGMDTAPPLGGLVITAPRRDPRMLLELQHPEGEPLLAHWQVGLGRVAAFTSDLGGRWSELWSDWPGSPAFWTQLVRTIARPVTSREAELITRIEDDRLRIALEVADDERGYLDYLQVEGAVYTPNGRTVPVRLRQVAPGRYEGSVPAREAGSYIVALNPREGTRQLAPVIGGASRATSDEFRRYESNLTLLREIAEITGGRVLDPTDLSGDPSNANLFDRSSMPRSVSLVPVWRTLLWWALIVLLLDVACRRIAWTGAMVRNVARTAWARVTPSHVRSRGAEATLSSLRTVSAKFDQQQDADAEGVDRFTPTGVVAPPPERPLTDAEARAIADRLEDEAVAPGKSPGKTPKTGPRSHTPDPERVSSALDALLGRTRDAPPKGGAASEASTEGPSGESDASDGGGAQSDDADESPPTPSTRSSLLAAKRRVREQMERGRENPNE